MTCCTLTGVRNIVFHFTCGGATIEATGNKQSIIENTKNSKVAVRRQQRGFWGPGVSAL